MHLLIYFAPFIVPVIFVVWYGVVSWKCVRSDRMLREHFGRINIELKVIGLTLQRLNDEDWVFVWSGDHAISYCDTYVCKRSTEPLKVLSAAKVVKILNTISRDTDPRDVLKHCMISPNSPHAKFTNISLKFSDIG